MKTKQKISLLQGILIGLILGFLIQCQSGKLSYYKYKKGFSLAHPSDWLARVIDNKYIFVTHQYKSKQSFLLIFPFFLNKQNDSHNWLKANLKNMNTFFNRPVIDQIKQIRKIPEETIIKFRFEKENQPFTGIGLCSLHKKSGMLFVAAAPRENFASEREKLLRMLASFRFEKSTEPAKTKKILYQGHYRTWQDPIEQAFSLEIPKGWTIEGGTFRRASVDLSHVLRARSEDGRMTVQFNDNNIPIFALPTSTLSFAGFAEGTWYSPGYGLKMLVKRYTPGYHFLNQYLFQFYQKGLTDFSIRHQQERSDIVANLNRIYQQFNTYNMAFSLHAGEISFVFKKNNQPFIGYGMAVTQIIQSASMGGGGQWTVPLLIIYACPEGQAEIMEEIISHMFQTVTVNPQWASAQQQLAGSVSQIVTRTSNEISQIINDSYWTRQQTMDNVNRRFSNYILGVTDVIDPETGEKWKAEAGHNYYWRQDYTSQVIGTDSFQRPDIDFSPLNEF